MNAFDFRNTKDVYVGGALAKQVYIGSVKIWDMKTAPTYTAPTKKTNLVYSGSPQALLNAGSTNHGTFYYSLNGTDWSTAIPQSTNASASIIVYWKLVGDSRHNDVASTSIVCSIAKADASYTAPTAKTLTYNGSDQALLNAGSTAHGTIQYSSDNTNWSTTIPTGKNATSYDTYWRLVGDSNHNSVSSTKISLSISKVTPTVVAPTAKVLTYNTQQQELVNAGSTNFGTLQYWINGKSWSTSIPTAKNFGSYTVYYKVVGDDNVNDVASATVACSIAEKRVSTPTIVLSQDSYTYDGNAKTPSVVVKDGDVVIDASEYTVTYSNNTNAGTATITISDNVDGNYNVTGSKTFSISKVTPSVTVPTAKTLTYNGSAQALANAGSTNWGTLQYSLDNSNWSTSIPTATNASTSYKVYYRVVGNSNINDVASAYISCAIGKANITPSVSISGWTYGGNANDPSVSGNSGSGSVTYYYKLSSAADSTYSTTKPSNAGSYIVKAVIAETSNYNGASATKSFSISKANLSASVSMSGWTYGATASSPSVSGNSGNGGVTYSYSSDGTTYTSTKPSNAGSYYVKAVIAETDNYNGATVTSTFTIAKATLSASVSMNGWTYGGTATSPSVSGNSGSGNVTYTYKTYGADDSTYSSTKPSNAGSYVVRAVIAETTNYYGATVTNTFVIGKASISPSVSLGGWTYGNTANNPSVSGNSGNGSVTYTYKINGAADSTYTSTKPSNAGTYVVRAVIAETANYEGKTVTSTFTIAKAAISPSVSLSGWTYGNTANNPSVSGNNGNGSVTYEYKVSGAADSTYSTTKPSNAGSYVVRATIAETTNYLGNSATKTFSIAKANRSAFAVSMAGWTYGGTATNPSVSGNTESGEVTYQYKVSGGSYSSTKPTSTSNAGTYYVKATAAATTNYNASTAEASFTIARADRTISFTSAPSSVIKGNTISVAASVSAGSGDGTISFSSSDTSKATVSGSTITGVSKGSVTITASVSQGTNYNAASKTYTLSVVEWENANVWQNALIWPN